MVAVVTATETAVVGAAMTAMGASTTAAGAPMTAPGIGTDGIAFATAASATRTDIGVATSAASMARTAWCFRQGVAHIVQYFPPLLEEVHAEEEEVMMVGLFVLVVVVRVVCAGCVCAARPCCFVRLTRISAPKKWQTIAYWILPECSR
jgi:hypothetical protein